MGKGSIWRWYANAMAPCDYVYALNSGDPAAFKTSFWSLAQDDPSLFAKLTSNKPGEVQSGMKKLRSATEKGIKKTFKV